MDTLMSDRGLEDYTVLLDTVPSAIILVDSSRIDFVLEQGCGEDVRVERRRGDWELLERLLSVLLG